MCQCLGGEPIEFENLRSPEQQAMMHGLYFPILTGMQQGTTPYPGQLSAPMTDAQKMAMKTMSGIGGWGWEQQSPQYRPVPNMYNPTNSWNLPVRGDGGGNDYAGSDASYQPDGVDPVIGIINELINRGGNYNPSNPGGGGGRERSDREGRKKA